MVRYGFEPDGRCVRPRDLIGPESYMCDALG